MSKVSNQSHINWLSLKLSYLLGLTLPNITKTLDIKPVLSQ